MTEIKKTQIDLFFDDSILGNGNMIQQSPVIPDGRRVVVRTFGGCDFAIGDGMDSVIALQWGSGTDWQTIRAGTKQFEYEIKREFIGDGVKRFRLVRINKSPSQKIIAAWLEALIHDA